MIIEDKELILRRFAANEMTEEDRLILRAAVVDAVKQARRRRTNRNPHYNKPSRAAEAWSHIYGTARAFAEWATDENIELAIVGLTERQDSQTSNVKAVRDCAARLTLIADKLEKSR